MKKLLLVLLTLFIVLSIAGCGGPSPKEEAKQFNETYYVQGWKNGIIKECNETINTIRNKYGQTANIDKILATESDIPQKVNSYLDTVKNIKIENKEIEPLKEKFTIVVNNYNNMLIGLANNDMNAARSAYNQIERGVFDYKNEYSKITTGKGLPVFNTPIGQLYAEEASNVLFTITDVSEAKTVGSGYFQESAQGKFIIVKVMVSNNQKDAITVDSNSFNLIDNQGRQFSTSVEGMTAVQISENHTKGFLTKLNPGMVIDSTFVYDVPTNLKISDFELEARGGMTGDKVKMPLAVRKTGY